MRLVDGRPAADVVADDCDAATAVGIIRGMVDSMEEVHGAGVVHLDMRLENVIVREGDDGSGSGCGGLVLVDFGSAALEDGVEPARDYTLASCVDVLPPELMDAGGVPSAAADVWALGVAAFRALGGGQGPWGAGTDFRVMEEVGARVSCGDLPFGEDVGEDARDFVQRCLEPRAEERMGVVAGDDDRERIVLDYDQIRGHPFLKESGLAGGV